MTVIKQKTLKEVKIKKEISFTTMNRFRVVYGNKEILKTVRNKL